MMYGMRRGGYGYHRGGCFLPGLLFFGLFILFFGRFLLPLLLLVCIAAPLIFWMKRAHWARQGGWQGQRWPHEWRNWHQEDFDAGDKPKRGDGDWV